MTGAIAETARQHLLAGRRLRVALRPGDGGLVYQRGDQFVYDCREGWAEGCVEPICDVGSAYINVFLDPCQRIDVDLGRWVPIKLEPIPTDVRVESAGIMRGGEVEWVVPPPGEPESEVSVPVYHDQTADIEDEGWDHTHRR